jgi:hypothetical protein
MLLVLPLLPSMSPTINLFSRTADNVSPDTSPQNGSPIPGTAVTNRPGHYSFDISALPNADYVVVSTNPLGTWFIRKTSTQILVSESWADLESTSISISPQTFTITPNGISGRNRLVFYNDGTQVITIVRSDGLEFDGTSMTFVIELANNTDLVSVSGLSSLTNTVNVTLPPIAFNSTPNKKWSLRRTIDDSVVIFGPAIMEYVAIASVIISISTYFLPGSTDTYIRPSGGMYLRT